MYKIQDFVLYQILNIYILQELIHKKKFGFDGNLFYSFYVFYIINNFLIGVTNSKTDFYYINYIKKAYICNPFFYCNMYSK